ncbi:hypothetical protein LCGC14_0748260 [marine sediment metagenome]|uniref:Transcription regulator PadR N-terminal domain-containing protein n=1 Tax=marine sediment metagenome TaxID=412755 RepID=A0A0F9QPL7_9ZZZZ|nr:MAG: Transcriptional regulator PadR-like family protein [Candidatus Lokiarchaeum sp. GC14_75]HDZ18482.1 hypothetical protein [archaeon]
MSKKVLFGALDTLEILLFLSSKKYISSGVIRKKFHMIKPGTIYQKLKKLMAQGFIVKKSKKMDRAGDDQMEYKLTEGGKKLKHSLVNRGLLVLKEAINSMMKYKSAVTKKPLMEDKTEQIEEFLIEFSEESAEMVDNETLKEQQKILERLLNKLL